MPGDVGFLRQHAPHVPVRVRHDVVGPLRVDVRLHAFSQLDGLVALLEEQGPLHEEVTELTKLWGLDKLQPSSNAQAVLEPA